MKSNGVIKVIGMTMGLLVSAGAAHADVVCNGLGESGYPVFKGFTLIDDSDILGWTKNAAVILNIGQGNILLTGKVSTTPTRVGSHVSYTLTDATGEATSLSYSSSSFLHCTRAGCDTPLPSSLTGTLVHAGETYELSCQN